MSSVGVEARGWRALFYTLISSWSLKINNGRSDATKAIVGLYSLAEMLFMSFEGRNSLTL